MKYLILVAAFAGLTASCNRLQSPASDHINGYEYTPKEGQLTKNSDGSLSGSGSLVFREPLSDFRSGSRIHIEFAINETGKLRTILRADEALTSGLAIDFERQGKDLAATLRLIEDEKLSIDLSTQLNLVSEQDKETGYKFTIDLVYTSAELMQVLIWSGAPSLQDQPLYNSYGALAGWEIPSGNFWGLVLNEAKVSNVSAVLLPEEVKRSYFLP